jgi:hypothetical protein
MYVTHEKLEKVQVASSIVEPTVARIQSNDFIIEPEVSSVKEKEVVNDEFIDFKEVKPTSLSSPIVSTLVPNPTTESIQPCTDCEKKAKAKKQIIYIAVAVVVLVVLSIFIYKKTK